MTGEGGSKEEALLRLRVVHASRAVASIEDTNFSLDKQRLRLDAAMNERMVEVRARKDLFTAQKRALEEDCSKLHVMIKERQQRITTLVKRYDIFIASLGKDDQGQQMSVTFFKIKMAAERAELREKGAALDADIGRREKDVSALEATMKVVAAAHSHFMHHLLPLADETPELEEVKTLTNKYYEVCDELKQLKAELAVLEDRVNELSGKREMCADKNKQLIARECEAERELEDARERLHKQEVRLQNAHDIVKYNLKRAKKLIEGVDEWRIFQLALWVRDYAEAHHNAIHALQELCTNEDTKARLAALLASTDLVKHMGRGQRRLLMFVQKIITEKAPNFKGVNLEIEESMFSTSSESSRSGASAASGFTQRFTALRRHLAGKVHEPTIMDEIEQRVRRSSVSLRVVTLGLEESLPIVNVSASEVKPKGKSLR
ncbi:hypothetical protein O0L34_g8147 [Tuta absoluta]|nr:hypothetical protein O0L34_g8147 [Tuta absoluta]